MLLFIDSFDHYSLATMSSKYEILGTGAGASITTGRFGNGFRIAGGNIGTNHKRHRFTTGTPTTIITGIALRFGSGHNTTSHPVVQWIESSPSIVGHIEMRLNGANQLFFTRGGTTIGTVSKTLTDDIWYYVEIKLTIHDSTGALEVRIDEAVELSLTGLDTKNGGTGYIDIIGMGTAGGTFSESYEVDYDDLYVLDTTGSTNNDYLGDVHIAAIFPDGNGTTSNLVGSDGNSTDNYLLVDETSAPNGDTDYVQSNVVGDKDTYPFQDVSFTTGDIYGLQINMYTRKTDAGVRQIASIARLSSTEVDGPNNVQSTSYIYYMDIREEKPGGGVWTATDINNAEFGAKVTA
jgi:hypothetical protein